MKTTCKSFIGRSHRRLAITFTNTLALAFAGVLATAAPAAAGPEPHDMTGSWGGFVQSIDNPNTRGAASFEVTSQDKRRFTGTFRTGGTICTLEGTISASGMMNAKGGCGPGSDLKLHGQVTEVHEGGVADPCAFEGRWTLRTAIGKDDGSVALLHFKGGPTELATGHWEGSAQDGGSGDPHEPVKPVMADFRTEFGDGRVKRGAGRVTIGALSDPDIKEFDVFFDIAQRPGSDTHGFALVGGGEAGILVSVGTFQDPADPTLPAMIDARHRLHLPNGDVVEGNVSLDQTPQVAQ